ncbi:MAG: hypothetical protein A2151_03175 [Candidatus Muproteobacteria bacterium RBG_16_65_34]|uniref:Uncharacterized protein n=1 Tax=Candidatus Muproteobacteria bacterium RBG_16_65_34 TaxID=1817760 RepID=A0A1F6TRH0_9PROT|nr:MAG: hypothetical protein A2151_03175 [Candidatus Muproteobacteria bacterium RBG_16_65_34]
MLGRLLAKALVGFSIFSGAAIGYSEDGAFDEETVNGQTFQIGGYGISGAENGDDKYSIDLPNTTNAVLRHYRTDIDKTFDYVVDTTIGPTAVAENKIWFGLNFYSGEGHEGIGGVGFFDPKTLKVGLLRHPAIIDCATRSIEVTTKYIAVLTHRAGEYWAGDCKGLIFIDRETLSYTTYRWNREKMHRHGDIYKDPALVKKHILAMRERRIGPLHDLLEKIGGPVLNEQLASLVKAKGLDTVMLEQAELERSWFRGAVETGETLLAQRCLLEVDKTWSLKCDRQGTGEVGVRVSSVNMLGNFCEPGGILGLQLDTNETASHGVEAQVFPAGRTYYGVYPAGRTYYGSTTEKQKYPIAKAGVEWSKYAYGVLHTLHIDSAEIKPMVCKPQFARYSGPGIHSMTVILTVVKPKQTYTPAGVARKSNEVQR